MKNFNYKYVVTPNKIIAISTYAGRTVRGIAKCHPNDKFDEEFGKKLAAARCNKKIADKRYARSLKKFHEVDALLRFFKAEVDSAREYVADSFEALMQAYKDVESLVGEAHDTEGL